MRAGRFGFTLVEVVVVLAIMGLAAAAVVPAIRATEPAHDVAASANELARVLRTARMVALERATPVVVTVDPARRVYLVETETDSVGPTLVHGSLRLAPGVRLQSEQARARFVFGRLGVADPDSIAVVGTQGSAVVGVDRWTGEVYVRVAGL